MSSCCSAPAATIEGKFSTLAWLGEIAPVPKDGAGRDHEAVAGRRHRWRGAGREPARHRRRRRRADVRAARSAACEDAVSVDASAGVRRRGTRGSSPPATARRRSNGSRRLRDTGGQSSRRRHRYARPRRVCYPQVEQLVLQAASHARRRIALWYPRDVWFVRLAINVQNAIRAAKGEAFRTFLHPPIAIEKLIRGRGFALSVRRTTWIWCADVYVRNSDKP